VKFLLDTNVVFELRKSAERRDRQFNDWAGRLSPSDTSLSVITVLELRAGIELKRRNDPRQAEVLDVWLEKSVVPSYSGRLLDIDQEVADAAARLHVPDRRPAHDALIAATALVHGLTLATRNVADFEPMDVPFVNPWAEQ
jgi:predicted nucleic acid-binding protein